MTTQPQQPADPFEGGNSRPSVSFKDCPVGTSYTGKVVEAPKLIQARDYETGQPAFYSDGNPRYTVVLGMVVDGEERSLWAPKPSSMFAAFADAQKKAGKLIEVGGTITVTFSGEKPNASNPRLNPQKLYTVSYTPPDLFESPTPAPAPLAAVPTGNPLGAPVTYQQDAARQQQNQQRAAPQWTDVQIAAAKAAGIPLPGIS